MSQAFSGISVATGLSGLSDSLTVTLAVKHGTLTLGTTAGSSVSLTGSTADINAALATLAYLGDLNFSGADTLSLTASVGSVSSQASVPITVLSSAQQATDLQSQVKALLQSPGGGIPAPLNPGQANALIVKLTNLKGNHGDIGKVQAFLNQVQDYVNSGKLTKAQAEPLLVAGKTLLDGLTV